MRARLKLPIALLFLSLTLSPSFCEQAGDHEGKNAKYVMTVLNAQWETTPIVLEAAEYLAEENADYLWSFIDGVNSLKPPFYELVTDKDQYETAVRVASSVLSPAQKALLSFSIGVHVNAAAVRMRAEMALQDGAGEAECDNVVFIAGEMLCNAADIRKTIHETVEHRINTYSVDHHYPGSVNRSITAILYGELGTEGFEPMHRLLAQYATNGQIHYVLRWHVKPRGRPKQRLSGYGVELQLKSTEYKSQDDSKPEEKDSEGAMPGASSEEEDENDPQNQVAGFNFGRLRNLFPDLRVSLDKFKAAMSQIDDELAPLKVWQMQKLSLQAGTAVAAAFGDSQADPDQALTVLAAISQNFPMQTKTLVHLDVSDDFAKEIKHNQETWAGSLNVHPSDAALFINGVFMDMDANDVMALLELLREDLSTLEVLHKIGLSGKIVTRLLSLEFSGSSKPGSRSSTQTSKTSPGEFALDVRDTAVIWANDLETDSQYKRWSASYMELLRPAYPGMLRTVRRNLFTVVIVVNPMVVESRNIIRMAESLIKHTAPVRVGIVLAPHSSEGVEEPAKDVSRALRMAFNYLCQDMGHPQALTFLTKISNKAGMDVVTIDLLKQILKEVDVNADLDDIFGPDSEYEFGHQIAKEFVQKTGSSDIPQAFANGVPIPDEDLTLTKFEDAILVILQKAISKFQRAIFRGELADNDDAMDYVMSQSNVMPRLNNRILSVESSQHLLLNGQEAGKELLDGNHMEELAGLSARDLTATALANLRYFLKPFKNEKKDILLDTVWVVGDLNDRKCRKLLLTALQYMKSSRTSRVSFIPNVDGVAGEDQSLNKVVVAALAVMDGPSAASYVIRLLEDEGCHEKKTCEILPELVPALNRFEWLLRVGRLLSWRAFGFRDSGSRGLLFNGRILGPLHDDEQFQDEDFSLLERFSNTMYGDKIRDILAGKKEASSLLFEETELSEEEPVDEPVFITADSYLLLVAALCNRQGGERSRFPLPNGLRNDHSVIKLPPRDPSAPAFSIVSVVDPASKAAQKLAPLLIVLRQIVNCEMLVYLNCEEKNSDMPVKSFYRLVLEAAPRFDASGAERGAAARISRLPNSALLSLEMRAPAAWLVESTHAVYDLDNIRLSDVDSVVYSEFTLAYILVEGHTWDAETGSPPRGLQLTLGPPNAPLMHDTLVMANLGYFQLKAYPGAWLLRLRAGRSHDIYQIVSHDNMETTSEGDLVVLVHSLRGVVVTLRVSKKPEKQHLDLLGDQADENTGIWNSITSSLTGGPSDAEDQTINIFSVASGHLYERFLRIMMLSVLKNTKSPVKFWFLKNYLSPSLKEILPYMSREYGFEYELVEYQWPRWLQRQSDRQRTIWGYKILFLDVLFPLSIRKIIFVDADQIVRADLKELVDLDLGGAPYGYTPFCDSRKEMEGFRFWKQGYWRNHLQGRRYHISALYVVDLRRFRRVAAGDRLRGQYQALSQDPNSLSNLDQDLPNNMIHQVAIKSLPQEWLWCETWCDNNSKTYAKTIDLCNNPQTKEAKLSAAMRIVPEWKDYDVEVKKLQAKVRRGDMDEDVEQTVTHSDHPEKLSENAKTPDKHTEL